MSGTAAILVALCLGCGDSELVVGQSAELQAHRAPFVQRHLLTGTFEAAESAPIKVPRTREHRLQIQWLIPDGSMVAKGDRVLEFDNSSFTANLDQQRSGVQRSLRSSLQIKAQGEAQLRDAEASVERTRIGLAKARLDATVPESIRSRFDHRTAQLVLSRARAQHDKAVADLKSIATSVEAENHINQEQHDRAVRELKIAEEAVVELVLTAPRDGITVVEDYPWDDRKLQVGDTVFTGWAVLGIPDLQSLRVRASLSDVDDGHLAVGMSARCTPDIEPDLHLPGHVAEITPIAREQRYSSERRGFDVIVDLEYLAGDTLLVPGMSVRVEVEVPGGEALLVSRAAVDLSSSPPRVLRYDRTWADVQLGPCSAQHCVVLDGVVEGTRLAAIGEHQL